MAKLSVIARDRKKEALVKRYAAKRKALKEAGSPRFGEAGTVNKS